MFYYSLTIPSLSRLTAVELNKTLSFLDEYHHPSLEGCIKAWNVLTWNRNVAMGVSESEMLSQGSLLPPMLAWRHRPMPVLRLGVKLVCSLRTLVGCSGPPQVLGCSRKGLAQHIVFFRLKPIFHFATGFSGQSAQKCRGITRYWLAMKHFHRASVRRRE